MQGPLSLSMAVSEKLEHVRTHAAEMTGMNNVQAEVHSSLDEIGEALKRLDRHVFYFYCHGGRTKHETWLGVGDKERLFPSDLFAWEVEWPVLHPIVFINGCHTVDVTPDDLLSFNDMLADCSAAGVIGTEIIIPETLARHFGKEFFTALLAGKKNSIGDVIKRQRLRLLEQYNPLGLVYTPYCSAELHFANQN